MMCMRYGFFTYPQNIFNILVSHTIPYPYYCVFTVYGLEHTIRRRTITYIYHRRPCFGSCFISCFFLFQLFCVISLIIIDSFNCMPFFPTHISNRINETACLFLFTRCFSFLSTLLSLIHSFFLSFFLSVFLFAYRTERQTWLNLQLHRDVQPAYLCVCAYAWN